MCEGTACAKAQRPEAPSPRSGELPIKGAPQGPSPEPFHFLDSEKEVHKREVRYPRMHGGSSHGDALHPTFPRKHHLGGGSL